MGSAARICCLLAAGALIFSACGRNDSNPHREAQQEESRKALESQAAQETQQTDSNDTPNNNPRPDTPAEPQSETLVALPGEEVLTGKLYDAGNLLKVSVHGVSFQLASGLRAGMAPGSPIFEVQSLNPPAGGVVVMRREVTVEEILKEMREPQDIGDGVVLQPEGQPKREGNRIECWFRNELVVAKSTVLISEHGNGVMFFVGAERVHRDWIERTVNAMADSVVLAPPQESRDERQWHALLSGQKLTYMRSSYDRDYTGGSTGSSTREEISLRADGRFHYYFRSTFNVTTPGGSAHGDEPDEDAGTWRIESVGAAVQLVLTGRETRRYTLTLSEERVFLGDRRFFRTALD